ncbi:uncharacterized protein LOC129945661 [Eupeodes corollae]|uniref:uncharacterized protein LOC129945661 n=1 Tax=Eupeodes corollae TaxID=290404 RepID=UPI002491A78A|nr:uncharacterized protein LOC129945661 [Eupeodes corollae]
MAKRRRKLRSLIAQKSAEPENTNSLKLSLLIGSILFIGFLAAAYFSKISTSMLWGDFLTTYRSQYNLIVHGKKDYCLPGLDSTTLFSKIGAKVLNQETALSAIELQFRNESKFVAIGIAGASGIGKSLFAQELMANFPWQENVQTHYWSTFSIEDNKQQAQTLRNHLSECGRNLIVIDNLHPRDVDFIREYNKMLSEQGSVNLAVVYVFNVVTYTEEQKQSYNDTLQSLEQSLEDVRIVEFRKFDSNDVRECIRHEVRNLNLTLEGGDFEEVAKLIDADRSGCKNVYSKVLMFGKRNNL